MKTLHVTSILALFILTHEGAALLRRWDCSVVPRNRHNRRFFWLFRFSRQKTSAYWFEFRDYTPYSLGPDCQSDWMKLWGKSRCGFFNHHHQDSDRFVWRALQTNPNGTSEIELAAYAYDSGDKPFQNPGRLLKPFMTRTQPGTVLGSQIEWYLSETVYTLYDSDGMFLESLTIEHTNHCENFRRGYRLGLYYGGTCRAPDRVEVCYRDARGDLS